MTWKNVDLRLTRVVPLLSFSHPPPWGRAGVGADFCIFSPFYMTKNHDSRLTTHGSHSHKLSPSRLSATLSHGGGLGWGLIFAYFSHSI